MSSIIRHRIAEFFLYGFQLVFQLFDLFEEIEASIIIVVTKNIAVIRGLFFFHLQCSFDVILLPENLGLVFYFFMQMRVLVSFFILNHRAVVSCWVDLESRYGCAHRHVALVKDVLLSLQSIFFAVSNLASRLYVDWTFCVMLNTKKKLMRSKKN